MRAPSPISTRPDTLCPCTTLFRASRDAALYGGGRSRTRGGLGRGLAAVDPFRVKARFILRSGSGDTNPRRLGSDENMSRIAAKARIVVEQSRRDKEKFAVRVA